MKLALIPLLAAAFGAIVVFGIYFAMGDQSVNSPANAAQEISQPQPSDFIPDPPKMLKFESLTKIFPSI